MCGTWISSSGLPMARLGEVTHAAAGRPLGDSNRSQGRGSSVQCTRDDERLEYVGEWSEVIGSRLTDDKMTSPLSG